MQSQVLFGVVALMALAAPTSARAQGTDSARRDTAAMAGMLGMPGDTLQAPSGRTIIPMIKQPMLPGLEGVHPAGGAFTVGAGRDLRQLHEAAPSMELSVRSGDTVALTASIVRRSI